ncbi:hypothetical protein GCM10010918_53530 [Paenibacillus radicis (ex Gao et al. 2016)]|uniref:Uncharacterized protein n=1 Tax=Paenibacillus radicis (ex Gao et al. 2016) TaxID=1737354 RepID=A0A917HT38_9BACL|nr:hypothetical protein GCM10010918_53530 [Paenibacillus radicis (ex Gao et al. 2016)]
MDECIVQIEEYMLLHLVARLLLTVIVVSTIYPKGRVSSNETRRLGYIKYAIQPHNEDGGEDDAH